MRFRFGWRKERKSDKLILEGLQDVENDLSDGPASTDKDQSSCIPLHEQAEKCLKTPRILFFGDHDELGNVYSLFLRSKGYEVFHFPSPVTCAIAKEGKCRCSRDHVCTDLLIVDLDMEGMTGLDLIRHQAERGCRSLPAFKAVISKGFTSRQDHEARSLGCKTFRKPFRLLDMLEWVRSCEKSIPADRKLTSHKELLETSTDCQ